MKHYIGVKEINAKPMTRIDYNVLRGWNLPSDENGADDGYLVEYIDGGQANHKDFEGYISWSPKDVFDRSYSQTDGMTFGLALEAIKKGRKVSRANWNGKGMWLGLQTERGSFIREECGTELSYMDYIIMKTADNKLVPWLASQTDMLSSDWSIV